MIVGGRESNSSRVVRVVRWAIVWGEGVSQNPYTQKRICNNLCII